MVDACKRAIDEWRTNVTNASVEKNWRKLWFTLDQAYTVIHICGDESSEFGYDMLLSYLMTNLTKLMFGYIYTDTILYGEYLLRIFKFDNDLPINVLEEIHRKANDKNEVTIDEIKQYVLKLVSSIINYLYTPY